VRPLQTHLVWIGRLGHSGFQEGDAILAILDERVLARRRGPEWDRRVTEAHERPGRFDLVRPLGPAVAVVLVKYKCY
jgi:hypothetical protein